MATKIDLSISEADAIRLTLLYLDEIERLAAAVGLAVRDVFENLATIDRSEIEAFIAEAGPYARAGQAEGADLAAAYLSEVTGTRVSPVDVVFPAIDFEGPFLRTWHNLSEYTPYDQAREGGSVVAEMTGYDAVARGADARMANPGTKTYGYRRVLAPGACEWCQVVATQRYKTLESASFGHHNCRCRAIAVVGTRVNEATTAINKARLADLRKAGAVERATKARQRNRERKLQS